RVRGSAVPHVAAGRVRRRAHADRDVHQRGAQAGGGRVGLSSARGGHGPAGGRLDDDAGDHGGVVAHCRQRGRDRAGQPEAHAGVFDHFAHGLRVSRAGQPDAGRLFVRVVLRSVLRADGNGGLRRDPGAGAQGFRVRDDRRFEGPEPALAVVRGHDGHLDVLAGRHSAVVGFRRESAGAESRDRRRHAVAGDRRDHLLDHWPLLLPARDLGDVLRAAGRRRRALGTQARHRAALAVVHQRAGTDCDDRFLRRAVRVVPARLRRLKQSIRTGWIDSSSGDWRRAEGSTRILPNRHAGPRAGLLRRAHERYIDPLRVSQPGLALCGGVRRRQVGMKTAAIAPDPVLGNLGGLIQGLEALYKDIHSHPELSMRETRTAGLAADRLRAAGYDVTTGVGNTGVVGLLRNGDGPTVMLRADMDALPVEEATGVPYASKLSATDPDGKTTPVMHACGHDMHVTWLAGAAALMAGGRDAWHGTLMAVFQPAEETAAGARAMIDDGLFKRFPKPEVILGQHVMVGPAGVLGGRTGAITSAADSLQIRLFGRGAHGSMPQASVDPVVMAAAVVMRLQTIVSREVAAAESAVVTVGALQAGAKENVIPDEAIIKLNVRTFDEG